MSGPQIRAEQAPCETAAHAAREAHAATVVAQMTGPSLHEQEMAVAHQGAPSAAVQDRTHGAPRPAVDKGGM